MDIWMGFGWFWNGFGWLRLDLDGFWMYVWMVFGWICEGWGEILDGCVMDRHGFWVVLGWTLTILETCFFWIGYDGFWWNFGGFGWILKSCRWAWTVPGVFRMQMCILSGYISSHIFQADMVHLPS